MEINEKITCLGDKFELPQLSSEDLKVAELHENKVWAINYLDPENVGKFSWIGGLGLALQNIGNNTLRCICIYDDPPAIVNLAIVNHTILSIGGILEYGDFTVLREWVQPEEDGKETEVELLGMEVA